METYCIKCWKKTGNLNPKNGRLIKQSKRTKCGIKKSRFVKGQDAKGLLSNLGKKHPQVKFHC